MVIEYLLITRIIFFFGFFGFLEVEDDAIDAVAQSGGWRTVVEDMSEVGFAPSAHHFGAVHAIGVVGRVNDTAFTNRLVEGRPATAAFKFGIAYKQWIAADSTIIGAFVLNVFQRAAPWSLRTFLAGYIVDVRRQYLFPLFVGHVDFGRIGVGINRVVLVARIHTNLFTGLGIGAKLQAQSKGQ